MKPTLHVALVTNIPSPYRNPVYERLPQDAFDIIFCARGEGNRQWKLPEPKFRHHFLPERVRPLADGWNFVHYNPEVWTLLSRLRPSVVVTAGMNPTHLLAWLWCRLHGVPHVYMTDGTQQSEACLGWKHRTLRRLVFSGTRAFVVASVGGRSLLEGYGVDPRRIFTSRLCADNARFAAAAGCEREFDVMFCGQLHERKLPLLFTAVCAELVRRRGRCRALVLGDGPMRETVLGQLAATGVDVTYPGFVQPHAMATWYARSRLLLFTTRLDPWGVVANEAMAAGTPVLTTPAAGVAGDLIQDGTNGRVLPPDEIAWATACAELLDDTEVWARYSAAAQAHVANYEYEDASRGIMDACKQALAGN